jgi:protein-L-isoaspartate(D-aspartate) O-methyltransferase
MHGFAMEYLADYAKPGSRVLDVGCGSGYLSVALARMVGEKGKVIGIDYIDGLVDLARKNVEKEDKDLLDKGVSSFLCS